MLSEGAQKLTTRNDWKTPNDEALHHSALFLFPYPPLSQDDQTHHHEEGPDLDSHDQRFIESCDQTGYAPPMPYAGQVECIEDAEPPSDELSPWHVADRMQEGIRTCVPMGTPEIAHR
jgi:hypothetical protein